MNRRILVLILFSIVLTSCKKESLITKEQDGRDAYTTCFDEQARNQQALNYAQLKYHENTHMDIAYVAAKKLGLPEWRAQIIKGASYLPDVYQSGIDAGYNQQWSHAFMQTVGGTWVWGDADDDFRDNMEGSLYASSHEGYNNKCARDYYLLGNKTDGDWYLGYALHYIADASLFLHATPPDEAALLTHHFDFEEWLKNNWTEGHKFKNYVESLALQYYNVSNNDLKDFVKRASKMANCNNSANFTYNVWKNYKKDGFPTAKGKGSANTVYYTKLMLKDTYKYTVGAMRYMLNKYNIW